VVPGKHGDGLWHCKDVAKEQSILLVRTGHEDGLSALIGFDFWKQEGLRRKDKRRGTQ
jgi:hypothetical protein